MKIWHKVSFPGGREYEQYSASFELGAEDVPAIMTDNLSLIERMFVFNMLVSYQGLLFQYLQGFVDKKVLDDCTKRLFSTLNPKLEKVVKSILKYQGNNNTEKASKKPEKTTKAKKSGTEKAK